MAKGLLLAAFDFSGAHADEFHDWYDLEHIPERRGFPASGRASAGSAQSSRGFLWQPTISIPSMFCVVRPTPRSPARSCGLF